MYPLLPEVHPLGRVICDPYPLYVHLTWPEHGSTRRRVGLTGMRTRSTGVLAVLAACALSFTGSAAAATAPTASTGPVTAVAPTTATVAGTVNPQGTATTWLVEYGTSAGYGSKTAAVSAGVGTTSQAVSASLASLKPGTTYHYRFVATSSAGSGQGADGILTTSSVPAVVTGSASAVTPTTATLTGTVDPSGRATTW